MALVTRPTKTGGNTAYVDEVAGGNTTAKSAEVDGDLDAIITQVNGNLDVNNLADDAVETAKIKNLNVTAGKLAVGVAASNFGLLGVTSGYLGASAIFRDIQQAAVTTSLNITTVESDVVVLPAVTAIASGYVVIIPSWALYTVHTGVTLRWVKVQLYRGAVLLNESVRIWNLEADGVTGTVMALPNTPYFDLPGAGSHIYTYKAITENADTAIQSNSAANSAGRVWAIAI